MKYFQNRQTDRKIENLYKQFQIYEDSDTDDELPFITSQHYILLQASQNEIKQDRKLICRSKMVEQIEETQSALEVGSFLEKLLK